MEPHPFLEHIEQICIVWFTLEYVSKMLVSYDRRTTALKLLNMIDLMAILPFLIEIALMLIGINTEELRDIKVIILLLNYCYYFILKNCVLRRSLALNVIAGLFSSFHEARYFRRFVAIKVTNGKEVIFF